MDIIRKATEFAKKEYLKNDPRHRWSHVEDVRKRAFEIAGHLEGVNYEILELAVIFHDVNYHSSSTFEENYKRHVDESAKMADEFLAKNNYPEEKRKRVVQAIMDHSTPHRKRLGESKIIEGKILYDSDKSIFMEDDKHKNYGKLYLKETKRLVMK